MSLGILGDIRSEFPALNQLVHGRPLVYLDSAATALKPTSVIERISNFYSFEAANIHRGSHFLGDQATSAYEEARQVVRQFINAESSEEVIFTKGTTESINLVAASLCSRLGPNDEVLLTQMEHHSNIVPWQMAATKFGFKVEFVKVTPAGEIDWLDFKSKVSINTKIISITHCSNVLGTINDIQRVVALAKEVGALTVVDGAQSVVYGPVDVRALGCDFFAFSGHKLFGPNGIGVLYGRLELLNQLEPYQGGGSMIAKVTEGGSTFLSSPFRFEAGTPPIAEAIGLAAAIRFVERVGWSNIQSHEHKLLKYAQDELLKIEGLKIWGQAALKSAVVSFSISGVSHSDIGQLLDQDGIAIRAGHHCAQPLMSALGLSGTMRASFSVYNSASDIDRLVIGLKKSLEILR
jgi:cysteine desulfurase / selenocysteine lyase